MEKQSTWRQEALPSKVRGKTAFGLMFAVKGTPPPATSELVPPAVLLRTHWTGGGVRCVLRDFVDQ